MFTAFQSRNVHNRRTRPRGLVVVAVLCLALLAMLTIAQVTHVHPVNSDSDHCPLCIVMHSAAPALAAAVLLTLVQVTLAVPAVEQRVPVRKWHAQLFIRPPPVLA